MEIYELVEQAKSEGYNEANAESKVCQDIILNLISHSNLNRNITIKGGVVMRSLSKNSRRATQDIDYYCKSYRKYRRIKTTGLSRKTCSCCYYR